MYLISNATGGTVTTGGGGGGTSYAWEAEVFEETTDSPNGRTFPLTLAPADGESVLVTVGGQVLAPVDYTVNLNAPSVSVLSPIMPSLTVQGSVTVVIRYTRTA